MEEKIILNKSAKEGALLNFVKVRFAGNPNAIEVYIGRSKFSYGQRVVALSDRGLAIGYINSFPYQVRINKSMLPLKRILRVANSIDLQNEKNNLSRAKEAKELCSKFITLLNLNMQLTHVEFTNLGKQLVFYFFSSERVDFRELLKCLNSELKVKIELRQIYFRDRSAALGGMGPCGLQLCCNRFLFPYGKVNIKMPKNQNFTLAQDRVNGVCGQIKCCMQYEDEGYSFKRKKLPLPQTYIKTKNGDIVFVLEIYILNEYFDALTDKGKKCRYTAAQYDINDPDNLNSDKLKFDINFKRVVDETTKIIF
ncbi:MAG: stage 0 sporulation protein [Oligoflexia bacterium]|nr:stage 0 sporulation protein [Oligoflexia bacterium]